jgi:hypothetical protein
MLYIYIYIYSWKFEFKSQFSGNTIKMNFNLTKYVLGSEYKYSIIKAYWLDFHKPIYILHSNHQKHFQCVTKNIKISISLKCNVCDYMCVYMCIFHMETPKWFHHVFPLDVSSFIAQGAY